MNVMQVRPPVASQLLRLAATAAALLVLAACAVGPDYRRPPDGLHPFQVPVESPTESVDSDAVERDSWWTGFGDPLLTQFVETARAANLSVAASLSRVQAARALARYAGEQLLPAVGAESQAARTQVSLESPIGQIASHLPGFDRSQTSYEVGASASWEIDLFGGLRRGRQAARAQFEAVEAAHTGVRITVSADTADSYLTIRGLQARRRLVIRQIDIAKQVLDLTSQKYRSGVANVRELSAAEAQLLQLKASLEPLDLYLVIEANRLDVLLGEQPGTSMPRLAELADIPHIPDIPGPGSTTEVLRRRPDVIAAERALAASTARIGQSLAAYYPKFSIAGLAGSAATHTTTLFTSTTFQTEAVAGLRWRLFDFGRVSAEVEVARAQRAEALAEYRASVLHAAEDVENAFTALARRQAVQSRMEALVEALDRSLSAAQESRRAGAESQLGVLEAERQLLQAQEGLARARQDCALAAVGTFRAIGGGW